MSGTSLVSGLKISQIRIPYERALQAGVFREGTPGDDLMIVPALLTTEDSSCSGLELPVYDISLKNNYGICLYLVSINVCIISGINTNPACGQLNREK